MYKKNPWIRCKGINRVKILIAKLTLRFSKNVKVNPSIDLPITKFRP